VCNSILGEEDDDDFFGTDDHHGHDHHGHDHHGHDHGSHKHVDDDEEEGLHIPTVAAVGVAVTAVVGIATYLVLKLR
jgi:hypothetical protein